MDASAFAGTLEEETKVDVVLVHSGPLDNKVVFQIFDRIATIKGGIL